MEKQFTLYVDESGSASLNPKDAFPYFSMGGIIVAADDKEILKARVSEFKGQWDIDYPLHGAEIRSKKKKFSWLAKLQEENPGEYARFLSELEEMLVNLPIVVHACVISRPGYLARYGSEYGTSTWELRKTAFSILLERAAKFVANQGGTLDVIFEKAGNKEDALVIQHFSSLRSKGSPFDPGRSSRYAPLAAATLTDVVTTIAGKRKENPMLQVADLCLYPVTQGKDKPDNRAFVKLIEHGLLVDCRVELSEVGVIGVKYFRFDTLP